MPRLSKRPSRAHRSRRARNIQGFSGPLVVAAGYFLLLAMLGGGVVDWSLPYVLLYSVAIAVTGLLAWQDGFRSLRIVPVAGRLALGGIVILPLLQLVPLPPGLWQALPGQGIRMETLNLAGMADSWQPLSLAPVDTAMTAILAAGFVTLAALLMRLDDAAFSRILDIALGVVILGILVGVLQVMSDGQLPRFYANKTGATLLGFYANKNHMGLTIAVAILLFGLIVNHRLFPRQRRALGTAIGVLFAFLCIFPTNSRGGLGFGALAVVIVFADLTRNIAWRYRLAMVAGTTLLALGVMSSSVVSGAMDRFNDIDDDLRWRILDWSMPLARQYWLLGSGAGSFQSLFNVNEHLAWVKPTQVNAAHNDFLQLVIEFGVPGVAVLALLLLSLFGSIRTMIALPVRSLYRREMLFGLAALALFAMHSTIDYPLRRPASWAFFALALAAVYRGRAAAGKQLDAA